MPEVLGDAVQQLGVADLVLDLGGQRELAAQGRRPHQPLALGEHAHQLGVRVHLDEAQDGGPVLVGHPVGRLDLAARGHVLLEQREPLVVGQVVVRGRPRALAWIEDGVESQRIGHRSASCVRAYGTRGITTSRGPVTPR